MIRPLEVERLRQEYRRAKPFPFVVIDDFLEEEVVREVVEAYPAFHAAAETGRVLESAHEQRRLQIADPRRFLSPVRQLQRALAAPEFLAALSRITGIPSLLADHELEGGGIDLTGAGGRLDVHVDGDYIEERQVHRRLHILVHLNSAWRDEWGGELELWDSRVKKRHHAIAPMLNRCVIFKTSGTSFHGVAPVTAPPNVVRKSFAGYYYTAAPPAQWDGVGHGTIFRARPGEKLKSWILMPLAEMRQQIDAGRKQVERIARRLLRPRV